MASSSKERKRARGVPQDEAGIVLMWGLVPGVFHENEPRLPHPVKARTPKWRDDAWKDVCNGGCGLALAISESGVLFTWGSFNDPSKRYCAPGQQEATPEPMSFPTEDVIVQAAAGPCHLVALTVAGEVYTCGSEGCVPLANTTHDQSSSRDKSGKRKRSPSPEQGSENSADDVTFTEFPFLVMFDVGVRITSIAAGAFHTLALSDVGQVWGWGYGDVGQLGLGCSVQTVVSPCHVPCVEFVAASEEPPSTKDVIVKAIACGSQHSVLVTDTGILLTFGWGHYGQCGQGNTDDVLSPTRVSSLLGTQIREVAAGGSHTLCISVDGNVYAFGKNDEGELGIGNEQNQSTPKLIDGQCMNAKVVSCGCSHSCMVTEDGRVFCWGWNRYGQLGLGDTDDRNFPCQVPLDTHVVKNVACGFCFTLAFVVKSDGPLSQ